MCGIAGYVGARSAQDVVLDGLRRLEYRGYDSAGLVLHKNGKLHLEKYAGRLSVLENKVSGNGLTKAHLGVGHTRWATHGAPTDDNAHPHMGCGGKFAVVHNGIIENYAELRRELRSRGHEFFSETDTEVIPHLIEEEYAGDLGQAVAQAAKRMQGAFAIAVVSEHDPLTLVAYRQYSPLIIGLGEGENFLASDIPALLPYTRQTVVLEDGDLAVLTAGEVKFYNGGQEIKKETLYITWDEVAAEKAGYSHFMLKEIHEQPRALRDTVSPRLLDDQTTLAEEIGLTKELIDSVKRVVIVACGTAYHAGLVGKNLIEKLARLPVEVDVASEFRYREPILDPSDLVIIISQSGETADTLAALREAKRQKCRVVAITNVVGSSVARESRHVLYTWAGPEIAVASTKAYTTQLAALTLMAVHIGLARGAISSSRAGELLAGLKAIPSLVEEILAQADAIRDVALRLSQSESVFFIGRGLDYSVALEGALKLKEISYIHAEAYAAGELKHGTLALVSPQTPVICLFTQQHLQEKMVSNVEVVRARGARTFVVTNCSPHVTETLHDVEIRLPGLDPLLAPILAVIPLQLIAYYAAVARGADVDKPRNLAKSVTVE
ncbi:MAG: glutamine--fructose-6-phosphate transaminase (isomerizing) [Firmicutes bacterium]|nr:glutamine--fructose-6-phosphate transaminase (isomerizing) [Dethiobacter sp.]MBS3889550.1 glutamine--fructose-6-phosphate transaminase (isomerizing) [Bacillota bacterium]MBS4053602.1 glutamine--fructose-6-phosphate transaminase (isomerizing) [Thermaerobacter sp.]